MRAGTAQQDANAPGVADDDRTDFQQGQAYRVGAGSGQPRLLQGVASQPSRSGRIVDTTYFLPDWAD